MNDFHRQKRREKKSRIATHVVIFNVERVFLSRVQVLVPMYTSRALYPCPPKLATFGEKAEGYL